MKQKVNPVMYHACKHQSRQVRGSLINVSLFTAVQSQPKIQRGGGEDFNSSKATVARRGLAANTQTDHQLAGNGFVLGMLLPLATKSHTRVLAAAHERNMREKFSAAASLPLLVETLDASGTFVSLPSSHLVASCHLLI